MALDYLFNGAPPQSVTGATSTVTGMPDWYQEYLRGIAGKATETAGQGFQQYPDPRLAGFNTDQTNAFDLTRQQTDQYQPYMQSAVSAAGQALPTASAFLGAGAQYGAGALGQAYGAGDTANNYASGNMAPNYAMGAGNVANNYAMSNQAPNYALGAGSSAVGAASGPAATWSGNFQQYMSPYTSSVVNEIGRLGNQNLNENILGGINDSFIGSGGFGSTRNADIIGRGIRDAQTNISGLQSQALQQGYGTSANIFASDAQRQQQQQQLQAQTALNAGTLGSGALQQAGALGASTALNAGTLGSGALQQASTLGANTALQGGQLGANTGLQAGQLANTGAQIGAAAADTSASRFGALGQLNQNLGYQQAGALGTIGAAQQGLQQQGYDLGYQNFLTQQGWNWNQLNNLNSVLRGLTLPQSQTAVTNQPYGNVGTSPLQWANMLYGAGNAAAPAPAPASGP